MIENFEEYFIFLVSLFAIVNPFAVMPVFISLTRTQTPDDRRRISLRTAFAAFVTLTISYFIGEGLLRFFSASILSLRIAGGLIIFRTAWAMLQGSDFDAKKTEKQVQAAQGGLGIAIVPLAIPLTAGPGAISLMIIAASSTRGFLPDVAAISSVLLVSVSILVLFRSAERISERLGETGMSILERLMGLILAVIAVELVTTAIGEMYPGLLK